MQRMLNRLSNLWSGKLAASFNVAHLSFLYVSLYAVLITTSPYGLFAQNNGSFGAGLDGTFGSSGLTHDAPTYSIDASVDASVDVKVEFDAKELELANCELMLVMKGSLGSLLATVAGIGAVFAGAMGMYSAAWTFVIVACSAFIIESIVTLWFPMPAGCDDERLFVEILDWATCRLLFVIQDMIGNLVATLAGIGAIVSCVMGAYKAAWAFLFTALGGFLVRTFVGFFFEENVNRCLGYTVDFAKKVSGSG